jgi:hypothetical protein
MPYVGPLSYLDDGRQAVTVRVPLWRLEAARTDMAAGLPPRGTVGPTAEPEGERHGR